jgi:hypothetical protein
MESQQENKPQDTGSNNVKMETKEVEVKLEVPPPTEPPVKCLPQ